MKTSKIFKKPFLVIFQFVVEGLRFAGVLEFVAYFNNCCDALSVIDTCMHCLCSFSNPDFSVPYTNAFLCT